MLDRIASLMFGGDPWKSVLEDFTRGRTEPIRSSEIEAHLQAKSLVGGVLSPQQHQRIHSAMAKLGWKKGEAMFDGVRRRAFVREDAP